MFSLYGDDCYLCGSVADTIDHVIPLSRGGNNDISNLRPACYDCNIKKGSQLLSDYLNSLKDTSDEIKGVILLKPAT